MAKRLLGNSVIEESLSRIEDLYKGGHRVVVSFSGGKDSTVVLNLARMATQRLGLDPPEVVFVDEEIFLPGTFEYALKTAESGHYDFYWVITASETINLYDRQCPYFWSYDMSCPDVWMQQPPEWAYYIAETSYKSAISKIRFPPDEGKRLYVLTGVRSSESLVRRRSVNASGGHIIKTPTQFQAYYSRPIYDWSEGDVWKFIHENKIDYNSAYDSMFRMKVNMRNLRVACPVASLGQLELLQAFATWNPSWFSRLNRRVRGVDQAVRYGERCVRPVRVPGETWQMCLDRLIKDPNQPEWARYQAENGRRVMEATHKRHAGSAPFPDDRQCDQCGQVGSYRRLAVNFYIPFGMSNHVIKWGPWARKFRPDFYHPEVAGLKADPWYDQDKFYTGRYLDSGALEIEDYLEEENEIVIKVVRSAVLDALEKRSENA